MRSTGRSERSRRASDGLLAGRRAGRLAFFYPEPQIIPHRRLRVMLAALLPAGLAQVCLLSAR